MRDSSNIVALAPAISDIAAIQNQVIQNENDPIKSIVTGSLLSPKGTILHRTLVTVRIKDQKLNLLYRAWYRIVDITININSDNIFITSIFVTYVWNSRIHRNKQTLPIIVNGLKN